MYLWWMSMQRAIRWPCCVRALIPRSISSVFSALFQTLVKPLNRFTNQTYKCIDSREDLKKKKKTRYNKWYGNKTECRVVELLRSRIEVMLRWWWWWWWELRRTRNSCMYVQGLNWLPRWNLKWSKSNQKQQRKQKRNFLGLKDARESKRRLWGWERKKSKEIKNVNVSKSWGLWEKRKVKRKSSKEKKTKAPGSTPHAGERKKSILSAHLPRLLPQST